MSETIHICPVCGGEEWTPDYDYTDDGEMRVDRCDHCQWPPPYPVTVQEWRRRTFFSDYLSDLEALLEKHREALQHVLDTALKDEEPDYGMIERLLRR